MRGQKWKWKLEKEETKENEIHHKYNYKIRRSWHMHKMITYIFMKNKPESEHQLFSASDSLVFYITTNQNLLDFG